EEHRPPDLRAALNVGADADDRVFNGAAFEIAAFGNDGRAHGTVGETRAGQESRVRVDGPPRIVELERRSWAGEHDVRLVERIDRSDVRPVPAEQLRVDPMRGERRGDDLAPEVGGA